MQSRSPPSFAQWLILYGLSIAIPVLALCGVLIHYYSVERYRSIEAEVHAASRELASELDGEIDRTVLLLETLSGTLGPEMDLARLHRHANETLVPRGSRVVVHDVSGWPILDTAVAFGTPLSENADPERIEAVIAKKGPFVSDLLQSAFVSRPGWIVSVPIRRHEKVIAVISIIRSIETLDTVFRKERRPAEWQWSIVDRQNHILARSAVDYPKIGSKLPDDPALAAQAVQGVDWVEGFNGVPVVQAVTRSALSGWLATISVPTAVVEAPLRDAWMLFAIGSLILLALALTLGISIARRLHTSVDDLVDAATRLGHGYTLPERTLSTREFQQIHAALSAAALERQTSESRRQLLLRELQHRTNNLLAVISSIARRTLFEGRTIRDARETLMGRLQALANASDTLTAAHWQGADIGLVVQNEMRAFAGRYEASGPPLMLAPQAVQNMSLVIHELATNASKYGALSQPGGQVDITWRIEEHAENDDRVPHLRFQWVERGGPPTTPPQRRGFGYSLLETVMTDIDRKPEIEFKPDGLSYTTTVRLDSVLASSQFDPLVDAPPPSR
jgi:two-component sensor histidine kinase